MGLIVQGFICSLAIVIKVAELKWIGKSNIGQFRDFLTKYSPKTQHSQLTTHH